MKCQDKKPNILALIHCNIGIIGLLKSPTRINDSLIQLPQTIKLSYLTNQSSIIPRLVPKKSCWWCYLRVFYIKYTNPAYGIGGTHYYGTFHIPLYPISNGPHKFPSFCTNKICNIPNQKPNYQSIHTFNPRTNIPPTVITIPLNIRKGSTQEDLASGSKGKNFVNGLARFISVYSSPTHRIPATAASRTQ